MTDSKDKKNLNSTIVVLDQAAGQKQIAILDALKSKYQNRAIIAGTINARKAKLDEAVVWEKALPYNRSNILLRMGSWLVFSIQAFMLIKRKYRKADLFIITNPPLTMLLTLFLKNTFDVLVFDLYPDALAEYKYVSKQSLLYRKWERWNVKIFKKARRVFTLSEGMAEQLSAYMDRDKIELVPLWTDNSFLQPIAKTDNPFVKAHGLENKFTVMYSGNMGLTHPVELLYELAKEMQDHQDIYFLLIGGGHKFKTLEQKIEASQLTNIGILPWQDADTLPYSMNAADVGVVTLDAEASKLSVPSKIFDLFSIGIPVLAVGAADSELSRLLNDYESGKCYEKAALADMKHYVLDLKNNKDYYQNVSQNSLRASLQHTPANALAFK